jgi:hypothetical protein
MQAPSRSNGNSQVKDADVQEVIRSGERQLIALLEQRANLMKRIGSVKQALAGLANMFGTRCSTRDCSRFWIARPAGSPD